MSGRRLTRRQFLAASGITVAAGLGVEGMLLEPRRLSVSNHRVGVEGAGDPPLRIAVITDLHLRSLTPLHEELAAVLSAAAPSCIALVGDSIDDPGGLPLLGEFLQRLPAGPIRLATLGNWEYWSGVELRALHRVYEAGETRLLVNEAVELADGAFVFGTDDSLAGTPSLRGLPGPDIDTLVLSHCPGYRDEIVRREFRAAAVISGHTHGGQVRVAGWAPVRPPGSGRYVSGWYRGSGADLFVSRGMGTSMVPVRIGSTPELALIDWYPAPR